ncbi:MAG: 6-phosphogluconolactonase, partial [Candidatus Eisenbacteria bacterium]
MTSIRLEVAGDAAAVAAKAAAEFLRLGNEAIAQHGAFRVALAGGDTPRAAYERIATTWQDAPGGALSWDRVHLYWGDERMVPRDDPRSNFGMARAALLSRVPIPAENIHPIRIDAASPEAAAADYEKSLRVTFPQTLAPFPCFDLVFLGIGADGHTASLFPGASTLNEGSRFAVAARHPETGERRVTLTLPVINGAASTVVLVSGGAKAAMLGRVRRGTGRRDADPLLPAERLRPTFGSL